MPNKITTKIQINKVWLEEQSSMATCECCKDVIYNKTFILWLSKFVAGVSMGMDRTDICLCESCFDLMNK